MEALEGRRDEGTLGGNKLGHGEDDPIERWIEGLRKDLEEGDKVDRRTEGLRSEAVFRRVLDRLHADRARAPWLQRVRRTIGMIFSIGAVVWQSHAARILMP